MPFYYLPNLSATETTPCEPWLADSNLPIFADKEAYRLWCNSPLTDHTFISAVEGKIPGTRVSETNPASRMAGLILDYDSVPDVPPEQSILAKAPSDLRPAWVSRTFSGNCRVLYKFEEPVSIFTKDIARQFVLKCQREFKLRKLLAGYEEEALLDLSKFYEVGRNWTPVGDGSAVIPTNQLLAWLDEASRKHKWEREGPCVPMDVVRDECIKRFPHAWPGGWSNFEEGARGPRFWDESASDPAAAIIRESGVQYYSDGGGFLSWEALFGTTFIRRWSDDRMGSAIKNFFYDGKDYWTKSLDGNWGTRLERDVSRALRIRDRLFKKAPSPTEESEVERALFSITEQRRVKKAMPILYRSDGLIYKEGAHFLNTSTLRPIAPVNDHTDWLEGFPRIAHWLGHAFTSVPGVDGEDDPSRQLNHLLSYLRHFYVHALNQDPRRGLALFVAGPVGAGKNLLNKGLISRLMGGSQDASQYLLGLDKFNDALFNVAHWRLDDVVPTGDAKMQEHFSHMVKNVVANDAIIFRPMYRSGSDIEWIGRVVVTMNADPESLRILPQTDINIADKLMLIMMKSQPTPGWEMSDAQLDAELPFFGAFLRDWSPPDYCTATNPRFGVATYAHPDLLVSAGSTSPTASFRELLELWRDEWFLPGAYGEADQAWCGNPTSLCQAIGKNDSLRALFVRYNANQVGMHLAKMHRQGVAYLTRTGDRTYAITRPQ